MAIIPFLFTWVELTLHLEALRAILDYCCTFWRPSICEKGHFLMFWGTKVEPNGLKAMLSVVKDLQKIRNCHFFERIHSFHTHANMRTEFTSNFRQRFKERQNYHQKMAENFRNNEEISISLHEFLVFVYLNNLTEFSSGFRQKCKELWEDHTLCSIWLYVVMFSNILFLWSFLKLSLWYLLQGETLVQNEIYVHFWKKVISRSSSSLI